MCAEKDSLIIIALTLSSATQLSLLSAPTGCG